MDRQKKSTTIKSEIFQPAQKGNIALDIVYQIEAAIVNEEILPGNRLPSERELQQIFLAGRGAIREAIQVLKQKSLIETKKGAKGGHFIKGVDIHQASSQLALMIQRQQIPLNMLLQFRYGFDRSILCVAIGKATMAELQKMTVLADQLLELCQEKKIDLKKISAVDMKLNFLLVEMTKNPFYDWIMRIIQLSFGSYDFALYEDPTFSSQTAQNWVYTAKALLNRDFQAGMQCFGHHYVLLDQCLRQRYGDKAVDVDGKLLRNMEKD
mgnify:FL=1